MNKPAKHFVLYFFASILLLILIPFMNKKIDQKEIRGLEVNIADFRGVFFTNKLEVVDLLTDNNTYQIIGMPSQQINNKILEHKVEQSPFIEDVQIYKDLKGNLKIEVYQSKPIARLFRNQKKGCYIDIQGNILPLHSKFTARVPLLEMQFKFPWDDNINETDYGRKLFELLNYINQNKFWNAQIAHLIVRKNGNIKMLPQITHHEIMFGKPDHFENKFSNLMLFYKKILPTKGWGTYTSVNVGFQNQIICKRNE